MDELTLDGKVYLSSKRAAAVTGYAKDYVGQLCREGRVEARLVGRSWYVLEDSIRKHRFSEESKEISEETENIEIKEERIEEIEQVQWEKPEYTTEEVEILPTLEEKQALEEEKTEDTPVSSMQQAWQEWFSIKKEEKIEEDPVLTQEEYVEEVKEEEQPVEIHIERNREPVETYEPVNMDIEPIVAKESRTEDFKVEKKSSSRRQGNAKVKALLLGLVVVFIAVTLVATGFLSESTSNLGVLTDLIEFISGKTVVK